MLPFLVLPSLPAQIAPLLPCPPETAQALREDWQKLQPSGKNNTGTRDFFSLVLEIASRGEDSRIAEAALNLAAQKHEPDTTSKWHGNYAWYWRDGHPEDGNAVEFCLQSASLTWMLYRDRLSEKARKALENEIRYSVTGLQRHVVPVSYTNIFLMKAANAIFVGEHLPDPNLAEEGYAMFDQWLDYTRAHGVHEYSSPTYYGVDLGSLGLLAKYPKRAEARANAEKVLRLIWTEIAANWFAPFGGIAGTHSRDYDFLCGHGLLDHYLRRAGWLKPAKPGEPEALIELSAWTPPAEAKDLANKAPRVVYQRWGEHPWECSTHYVGRHFTLGSAGSSYCPQDKVLTLNLPLDPKSPVINFAMDERGDPYGSTKVVTGGGHLKLTHLVPFLTSVQKGSSALLLAAENPQKKLSPTAESLESNLVFSSKAEVWLADQPVKWTPGTSRLNLSPGTTVFLRSADVAVALRYVLALDPDGHPAAPALINDGGKVPALRFTATHSDRACNRRVVVAVWIHAAEGLDEAGFAAFRRRFSDARTPAACRGDVVEVSAPSDDGTLRLSADLKLERRLVREGADLRVENGILSVDGHDFGQEILGGPGKRP